MPADFHKPGLPAPPEGSNVSQVLATGMDFFKPGMTPKVQTPKPGAAETSFREIVPDAPEAPASEAFEDAPDTVGVGQEQPMAIDRQEGELPVEDAPPPKTRSSRKSKYRKGN